MGRTIEFKFRLKGVSKGHSYRVSLNALSIVTALLNRVVILATLVHQPTMMCSEESHLKLFSVVGLSHITTVF